MLPQAIIQNVGGTISVEPPVVPGAAPTVTVRTDTDAVIAAAAVAVRDALAITPTTLASAAALGVRELTLASATGVVAGRRYRIGPADPATAIQPIEWVFVRSIAGAVLTLREPTRYAHLTAAVFSSTRLTYLVTAAQATTQFFDGHAEWDIDSTTHPENIWTGVECTLRRLENLCTEVEVGALDPRLWQRLHSNHDSRQFINDAFERVLQRLGGAFRVRTMVGSDAFIEATAYRALYDLASHHGDKEGIARFGALLDDAVRDLLSTRPADLDQDGAVEPHEAPPGYGIGRVDRG